jgi:beta-lactamase class A
MKHLIFVLSIILINANVYGQVLSLPIDNSEAEYQPFKGTNDKQLTKALLNKLKENTNYAKLIRNKKLCLGVVDISNPSKPRYASINGNHMMYAASLPKIAILLGVMDAVDKKEVKMTPEIHNDLTRMIRYSDNHASTRMIDLVGYEKIAKVLKDPKYDLYNEKKGGGLWVGKRYAAGGRRFPEPIKGLSHAASVNQVCKFYYMLAYGKLISCDKSEEMLEYMADPALHHKFVNCLNQVCPDAEIYRKSGTWKTFHADSVLVIGKEWRSYILVALVDDANGESIIREMLPIVEDLIK